MRWCIMLRRPLQSMQYEHIKTEFWYIIYIILKSQAPNIILNSIYRLINGLEALENCPNFRN